MKLQNEATNNFNGLIQVRQDRLRNYLRITGIPEKPGKRNPITDKMDPEDTEEVVCNFLKDNMDITVTVADLDSARRVRKTDKDRNSSKPRPIVCEFIRHSVRQKVITNRRKLKGTGIGIHEMLTEGNRYVYEATQDMAKSVNLEEVKKVWTWNGVTHILAEDDKKIYRYVVRSIQDINNVEKLHSGVSHKKDSNKPDAE